MTLPCERSTSKILIPNVLFTGYSFRSERNDSNVSDRTTGTIQRSVERAFTSDRHPEILKPEGLLSRMLP